jgi:hypothetical protein
MTHAYENQLFRKKRKAIPQDTHSISQKILKVADPGIGPGDKEPDANPSPVARKARKPKMEIHAKRSKSTHELKRTKAPRSEPLGPINLGSSGIHATVHIHVAHHKED